MKRFSNALINYIEDGVHYSYSYSNLNTLKEMVAELVPISAKEDDETEEYVVIKKSVIRSANIDDAIDLLYKLKKRAK